MQKILVEKNEAVADLIERILEVEGNELLLVIPKKSHLLDSPNNFRLLAREAQVLGKTIQIESVDPEVLELAKANGLASSHPLFGERVEGDDREAASLVREGGKKRRGVALPAGAVALKVQNDDEVAETDDASAEEAGFSETPEERFDTVADYRERSSFGRIAALIVGALVLVAIGMWAFAAMFGRADVTIRFKRTPWNWSDAVAALTSVKDIDATKNLVPGQLFEEEKSLVQNFPASGHANVNSKAQGTITVVNAYSSAPQQLVATTRFQTPDGKIFRLDNAIVVPGATVNGNKITPASIKAPVTADVAGEGGNVGPIAKLTIPGFKNGPKFDGFYGTFETGTSGGATGERAVATDADVNSAKGKVSDTLKSAFQTSFLGAIPSDIKVLDGASLFTAGTVTVQRTADQSGNFTLTSNAVFDAFGFREKDVLRLLDASIQGSNAGMKIDQLDIKYSSVQADFSKKELKFAVSATGSLVPAFDADAFKAQIAGEKKDTARAAILALPQLETAEVKLWPAWLWSVPGAVGRIKVTVQ
jgi:hypothetical protein